MLRARSLKDALGYMFMPPGWAPDGKGLTTEQLRAHMKALTGSASGVPPEALLDGKMPLPAMAQNHGEGVSPSHAPAR